MEQGYVQFKSYKLEYFKSGKGSKVYLAFHGNGRHAEDFLTFEEDLDATIYSFNLFFHGKSTYQDSKIKNYTPISKEELKSIFNAINNQLALKEVNFIAYSLGSKFTLNYLNFFPEKVRQVILMAPDGLAKSIYTQSSKFSIIRNLFRYSVVRPKIFIKIIKKLSKSGILTERISEFILYNLECGPKRLRAYLGWRYLRKLFPDHNSLKKKLSKHSIDLILIMGEYDKVIPMKFGRKFIIKMNRGRLLTLATNHHFFRPTTIPEIKKMLCILAQQEYKDEQKN